MRKVREVEWSEGLVYKLLIAIAIPMMWLQYVQINQLNQLSEDTSTKMFNQLKATIAITEHATKKAVRYAGVIAHAGNDGAFRIGDNTIVQCFAVSVPDLKEKLKTNGFEFPSTFSP